MTDWLYLNDSYEKSFSSAVKEVVDDGVILSRSAFYPGGGGQPKDLGKLSISPDQAASVAGFRRTDTGIVHQLDPNLNVSLGQELHGQIDWPRRYLLMRTHTTLHILSAIIWRDFRAKVTGGNMDCGTGRLDFEFAGMGRELIPEIEEKINIEVEAGRDITTDTLPREEAMKIPDLIRTKINLLPAHIEQIRIVKIDGLDLQADGGTHVANTREVGAVAITKYRSKGKNNKRLHIALRD